MELNPDLKKRLAERKARLKRQQALEKLWNHIYFLIVILLCIILLVVSLNKTAKNQEVSPTPTPAPEWITAPDGSQYRSDICEQYAFFSLIDEKKNEEYVVCPEESRGYAEEDLCGEKCDKIEIENNIEWDEETGTGSGELKIERTPGITGNASYYSREGCIGCSESLTMANGEPLDDSAITVAYNRAPLNSYIEITNVRNNRKVTAKVTDTGGFEAHGKIVDLSVATKEALGCGDVCKVEIIHL